MGKSIKLLSKSRIKRGLQCPKSLHLTLYKSDLEAAPDTATQFNFDEGNEVGEKAREEFPNGVLVDKEPWDYDGCIKATQEAISSGSNTIFEASFSANGLFARVDILTRSSSKAKWQVIEVKKAGKLKEEYVEDIAIQALVLEHAEIPVKSYSVMHLNPACTFPNLKNLFVIKDVTQKVEDSIAELKKKIKNLQKIAVDTAEPKTAIGPHCNSPYECAFVDHCWKGMPSPNVFDLPGVGPVMGWKLIKGGKIKIEDLDEKQFKGKTRTAIETTKTGNRWVQGPQIKKAMESWDWPYYFLDFETLAPAIPRYDGCSPYSDLPFQFSCHVWKSQKAPIEHFEYLHLDLSDPRPKIAEALVSGFGPEGPVLAYSAGVERKILLNLAKAVPKYSKDLKQIASRLVDPLPVFQKHVYDVEFRGSFSIKEVAPALVGPSMDYSRLKVSNGMEARAIVEKLMRSEVPPEQIAESKEALLQYCRQDTIAMVELLKWMLAVKQAA